MRRDDLSEERINFAMEGEEWSRVEGVREGGKSHTDLRNTFAWAQGRCPPTPTMVSFKEQHVEGSQRGRDHY